MTTANESQPVYFLFTFSSTMVEFCDLKDHFWWPHSHAGWWISARAMQHMDGQQLCLMPPPLLWCGA